MYFRQGGGTIRGIARPSELVWGRVFIEAGRLRMNLGRAKAVRLPLAETERCWREARRPVANNTRRHVRRVP